MEKLITYTLETLLLPPGGLLLLLVVGLLLLKHKPRFGYALLFTTVIAFYALSTPFISALLMWPLEVTEAIPPSGELRNEPHAAVVILGGGRIEDAPEYGGDTVSTLTLERVRYGARLARRVRLPILVTGGSVWEESASEASLMQQALEQDFNTPARWVEGQSRTTWENARYTKEMLAKEGITRIYLVTHAWHLPRSEYAFRHFGFEIIPAPTSFTNRPGATHGISDALPEARSLRDSYFALHEMLGLLWYHVKAVID